MFTSSTLLYTFLSLVARMQLGSTWLYWIIKPKKKQKGVVMGYWQMKMAEGKIMVHILDLGFFLALDIYGITC